MPTSKFARFLKDKVEKNKDLENLLSYANLMDVDKDGRICKDDLQTCLCNVGSDQFFKNGGQNLKHTQFNAENKFYSIPQEKLKLDKSDPKLVEIRKQIKSAFNQNNTTYSGAFNRFDSDGDKMLNFAEFQKGMAGILQINQPTLEKMFNLMDEHKIGMVSYD